VNPAFLLHVRLALHGQNPSSQLACIFVRHLRVRGHRNRAPNAFATLLDYSDYVVLSLGIALVFLGDILERRADNLLGNLVAAHAGAFLGQSLISGSNASTHSENGSSSDYDSFHIESPVLVKATCVARRMLLDSPVTENSLKIK
jgi:hypothetical protein